MFNGILTENMSYYVDVSSSIGGPALEQAKLVREAFQLCLGIMQMSRKYSKPSASEMAKIMQPLSFKLYEIAVSLGLRYTYVLLLCRMLQIAINRTYFINHSQQYRIQ